MYQSMFIHTRYLKSFTGECNRNKYMISANICVYFKFSIGNVISFNHTCHIEYTECFTETCKYNGASYEILITYLTFNTTLIDF